MIGACMSEIDGLCHCQVPDYARRNQDKWRNLTQVDRPAILTEMQECVAQVDKVIERRGDVPVQRQLKRRAQ